MATVNTEAIPLASRQSENRPSGKYMGEALQKTITTALLIFCTALFFTPFLWLISASLKVRSEVFSSNWIPNPIAWENYVNVWKAAPLLIWLRNSLVVGTLAAVTVTISCSLIAFGFSYFRFRGRDTLFGLVLATMMLPGVVTMIPVFIIWNSVGLANTQIPLWASNIFGSAFYIFMIRQFYLSSRVTCLKQPASMARVTSVYGAMSDYPSQGRLSSSSLYSSLRQAGRIWSGH